MKSSKSEKFVFNLGCVRKFSLFGKPIKEQRELAQNLIWRIRHCVQDPPKRIPGITKRKDMLQFLEATLPKEIICEIALFDGRILRAYLRDYVSEIYARVYKRYFGYRYTLKFICGTIYPDRMAALPFYSAWGTSMRKKHPEIVKPKPQKKFMRPYRGIIPTKVLRRERLKVEDNLAHFFCPRSEHLRYRGLVPVRRLRVV
jgi:hypothetical protein